MTDNIDTFLGGLRQRCEVALPAMLSELQALVEQNSYTQNIEGCAAVATRMAAFLSNHTSMETRLIESKVYGPHLTSLNPKNTGASEVALVGHHDTVFPEGTFEGFRHEKGIAYGPGVLDMKGGLTVAMFALKILHDGGHLDSVPVKFISVAEEEIGSPESGAILTRETENAACALVFEAGRQNDMIITARKGTGGLTVTARGKAAHAGNHHADGANAIWALAHFIDAAQNLTDYDRGLTVNVGTIVGGEARNTVPDLATARVDIRFLKVAHGQELVTRLKAAAADAAARVPGVSIEVEGGVKRPPLERTDHNVALFQEYAKAALAAGLQGGECPLIGGGSDAATVGALGIAAIDGMGPRGKGFHTKDEFIEVATLPQKTEALVRFLLGRRSGG